MESKEINLGVGELLMFMSALERLDPNRHYKKIYFSSNLTEKINPTLVGKKKFIIPELVTGINKTKVECKINPKKRRRDSIYEPSDEIDEIGSEDISYESGDEFPEGEEEVSFDMDDGESCDTSDVNNVSESSVGSVDNDVNCADMVTSPVEWAKLTFDQRLKQLEVYKKKYGHCKVPQLYKENPSMGLWVRDLRVKKRKGKLSTEVEKRLSKLGFVWNCRKRKKAKTSSKRLPWNERYTQLKNFFEKHGHCKVPSNHKNKQLYHWVTNQRRDYRCGVMPFSRVQKLESIGFEWNSQRKKSRKKFKAGEDDDEEEEDDERSSDE